MHWTTTSNFFTKVGFFCQSSQFRVSTIKSHTWDTLHESASSRNALRRSQNNVSISVEAWTCAEINWSHFLFPFGISVATTRPELTIRTGKNTTLDATWSLGGVSAFTTFRNAHSMIQERHTYHVRWPTSTLFFLQGRIVESRWVKVSHTSHLYMSTIKSHALDTLNCIRTPAIGSAAYISVWIQAECTRSEFPVTFVFSILNTGGNIREIDKAEERHVSQRMRQ